MCYSDRLDRDISVPPVAAAAPSAAAKHEWRVSQAILQAPDGGQTCAGLIARSCSTNVAAALRGLAVCNGRTRPAGPENEGQCSFAAMDVTTNSAFRIVFGVASQTLDAAVICFGSPDPLRNTEASNLLAPQILPWVIPCQHQQCLKLSTCALMFRLLLVLS